MLWWAWVAQLLDCLVDIPVNGLLDRHSIVVFNAFYPFFFFSIFFTICKLVLRSGKRVGEIKFLSR
jgi:hypothetical protein